MKTPQLSVRLSDEIRQALAERAERAGVSLAAYVAGVLAKHVGLPPTERLRGFATLTAEQRTAVATAGANTRYQAAVRKARRKPGSKRS